MPRIASLKNQSLLGFVNRIIQPVVDGTIFDNTVSSEQIFDPDLYLGFGSTAIPSIQSFRFSPNGEFLYFTSGTIIYQLPLVKPFDITTFPIDSNSRGPLTFFDLSTIQTGLRNNYIQDFLFTPTGNRLVLVDSSVATGTNSVLKDVFIDTNWDISSINTFTTFTTSSASGRDVTSIDWSNNGNFIYQLTSSGILEKNSLNAPYDTRDTITATETLSLTGTGLAGLDVLGPSSFVVTSLDQDRILYYAMSANDNLSTASVVDTFSIPGVEATKISITGENKIIIQDSTVQLREYYFYDIPEGEKTFGPGEYSWVVPENITTISIVGIGRGGDSGNCTQPNNTGLGGSGGGGGALGYINDLSVTPGETLTIRVGGGDYKVDTQVLRGPQNILTAGRGTDGAADGGTPGSGGSVTSDFGAIGFSGGSGRTGTGRTGGGGGGAAGYGANGTNGTVIEADIGINTDGDPVEQYTPYPAFLFEGGTGGDGAVSFGAASGGGTNVYGIYTGGERGRITVNNSLLYNSPKGVSGLGFGAGAGGGNDGGISPGGTGGPGVVRIIWPGNTRQFPDLEVLPESYNRYMTDIEWDQNVRLDVSPTQTDRLGQGGDVSEDGRYVYVIDFGGTFSSASIDKIWQWELATPYDLTSATLINYLELDQAYQNAVGDVLISPDGNNLYIGGYVPTEGIAQWRRQDSNAWRSDNAVFDPYIVVNPDNVDTISGTPYADPLSADIFGFSISKDGKNLIYGDISTNGFTHRSINRWDLSSVGSGTFSNGPDRAHGIEYSSDGTVVYTGDDNFYSPQLMRIYPITDITGQSRFNFNLNDFYATADQRYIEVPNPTGVSTSNFNVRGLRNKIDLNTGVHYFYVFASSSNSNDNVGFYVQRGKYNRHPHNIIKNGLFDQDGRYWTIVGSTNISYTDRNGNTIATKTRFNNNDVIPNEILQTVEIIPGANYKLTLEWERASFLTSTQFTLEIIDDYDSTVLYTFDYTDGINYNLRSEFLKFPTSIITVRITLPAGDSIVLNKCVLELDDLLTLPNKIQGVDLVNTLPTDTALWNNLGLATRTGSITSDGWDVPLSDPVNLTHRLACNLATDETYELTLWFNTKTSSTGPISIKLEDNNFDNPANGIEQDPLLEFTFPEIAPNSLEKRTLVFTIPREFQGQFVYRGPTTSELVLTVTGGGFVLRGISLTQIPDPSRTLVVRTSEFDRQTLPLPDAWDDNQNIADYTASSTPFENRNVLTLGDTNTATVEQAAIPLEGITDFPITVQGWIRKDSTNLFTGTIFSLEDANGLECVALAFDDVTELTMRFSSNSSGTTFVQTGQVAVPTDEWVWFAVEIYDTTTPGGNSIDRVTFHANGTTAFSDITALPDPNYYPTAPVLLRLAHYNSVGDYNLIGVQLGGLQIQQGDVFRGVNYTAPIGPFGFYDQAAPVKAIIEANGPRSTPVILTDMDGTRNTIDSVQPAGNKMLLTGLAAYNLPRSFPYRVVGMTSGVATTVTGIDDILAGINNLVLNTTTDPAFVAGEQIAAYDHDGTTWNTFYMRNSNFDQPNGTPWTTAGNVVFGEDLGTGPIVTINDVGYIYQDIVLPPDWDGFLTINCTIDSLSNIAGFAGAGISRQDDFDPLTGQFSGTTSRVFINNTGTFGFTLSRSNVTGPVLRIELFNATSGASSITASFFGIV